MLVLIDIGNTLTKVTIAKISEDKINNVKKIVTHDLNWDVIITMTFKNLAQKFQVRDLVLVSVVPRKTKAIENIIEAIFFKKPLIINPAIIASLKVNINLNKKQVGSDFIAITSAVEACYNNAIVVSLGTATTYSVVVNKELVCAIIGPGFTLSKNALIENTALLKDFKLKTSQTIFAQNTEQALSVGFGNGFNYMIKSFVADLKKTISEQWQTTDLKIIITGGAFQELQPFLNFSYEYDEFLVMRGLIVIYQELNNTKKE